MVGCSFPHSESHNDLHCTLARRSKPRPPSAPPSWGVAEFPGGGMDRESDRTSPKRQRVNSPVARHGTGREQREFTRWRFGLVFSASSAPWSGAFARKSCHTPLMTVGFTVILTFRRSRGVLCLGGGSMNSWHMWANRWKRTVAHCRVGAACHPKWLRLHGLERWATSPYIDNKSSSSAQTQHKPNSES